MINGWVKNWRQIKEWQWYKVDGMAHLFQHLIREANHDTQKWQGETISRGQVICGRKTLSVETGLSEQTIRTCLSRLKSTSEITIKTTNRFSVITINQYDTYQSLNGDNNKAVNQPANQQSTSNQPAINQQSTTNKNTKNIKNDKNTKPHTPLQGEQYSEEFLIFWNIYPKKIGKGQAYRAWKKIKGIAGLLPEILKAVELQSVCPQWKKDGGQFIPNPATWLNGSRWEDEVQKDPMQAMVDEMNRKDLEHEQNRIQAMCC
jgi:hypothetical protein